jgi:hypothetical protein
LDTVEDPTEPVLHQIGDVADGVAVRQKVPATSAISVVVEPRAEDQVRGDAEEDTALRLVMKYGVEGEK